MNQKRGYFLYALSIFVTSIEREKRKRKLERERERERLNKQFQKWRSYYFSTFS